MLAFAYGRDATLAFASDRSGETAIWLRPPGEKALPLARFGTADVGGLAWSPEGERLAFIWAKGRSRALRVVNRDGANLAIVPLTATTTGWPAWAADGRSILCPISDQRGWRIWRIGLSREEAPVPVSGYGWASVATRELEIYAAKRDRPGIWRLGDPPRLIAASFQPGADNDWTIFKDQVVFSDARRNEVLSALLSGGPTRVAAHTPATSDLADIGVDPASGAIAYRTAADQDSGIELFHLERK